MPTQDIKILFNLQEVYFFKERCT